MILALLNKNIEIDNEKCVSISYPKFKKDLKSLLKKKNSHTNTLRMILQDKMVIFLKKS